MKRDELFFEELKEMDKEFSGWDFSYVTGTDRIQSGALSWSYGSKVLRLMRNTESMLDMGTGGGEFLSRLRPLPDYTAATEGYEPNLPVARDCLEPLGVNVVQTKEDDILPFEDNRFDLIVNKHESFDPSEVKRVLKPGGTFLTQQVGGLDCLQINEALHAEENEYKDWNLTEAMNGLKAQDFKVITSREDYPVQRFFDIGALVYYLKAIPWQVPGFNLDDYQDALYSIYGMMKDRGYFEVRQHRFLIQAEL
ncbi:class I SAM-dependent methyltransferase [Halobacillus mangrovi]|uniref:class I SAM-dependent methyltransferase n=1 Tax=Halobacillus mangrovi TaxID=402384 RepID=UPI003D97C45D